MNRKTIFLCFFSLYFVSISCQEINLLPYSRLLDERIIHLGYQLMQQLNYSHSYQECVKVTSNQQQDEDCHEMKSNVSVIIKELGSTQFSAYVYLASFKHPSSNDTEGGGVQILPDDGSPISIDPERTPIVLV